MGSLRLEWQFTKAVNIPDSFVILRVAFGHKMAIGTLANTSIPAIKKVKRRSKRHIDR